MRVEQAVAEPLVVANGVAIDLAMTVPGAVVLRGDPGLADLLRCYVPLLDGLAVGLVPGGIECGERLRPGDGLAAQREQTILVARDQPVDVGDRHWLLLVDCRPDDGVEAPVAAGPA